MFKAPGVPIGTKNSTTRIAFYIVQNQLGPLSALELAKRAFKQSMKQK